MPVILLFVVALLSAVGSAAAQSAAPGAVEIGTAARSFVLVANKARIIELQSDARDVLVTNPAVADVVIRSPRRVYVLGKAVGETNVFFFDRNGDQIDRLEIRVELDLAAVRAAFADLLPNESIAPKAINQTIVLTGRVRSARASENARSVARRFVSDDSNVVNMLAISEDHQVLLQVRISEMSRRVTKQLGVNTTIGQPGHSVRVVSGQTPPTTPFGTTALDFARIFNLGGVFATFTSVIDALEEEGLVKTLAQPNLTAVSGESAKFLVGGEFPIPVQAELNRITIEFKQFGVLLTFTPVVLESGLISLRLVSEVSQVTFENQIVLATTAIPGLTVRRAETTVEIPSGGSMVIAGLLRNDNENTVRGLPFLKDIPVLGALFRSTAFQRDETELVVTVAPYLVRPIDSANVPLPTDGFVPASDVDLYLLGRLHAVYARPGELPPTGVPKGPLGYIME